MNNMSVLLRSLVIVSDVSQQQRAEELAEHLVDLARMQREHIEKITKHEFVRFMRKTSLRHTFGI